MLSISIIGTGNLSFHLAHAFDQAHNCKLVQLIGRAQTKPKDYPVECFYSHKLEELKNVDLVILAVSDNAIQKISYELPQTTALVVHTSGSIPLLSLNKKLRRGVCYPLQTFSKHNLVDFSQIPFCLETENAKDTKLIEQALAQISRKIYILTSDQRSKLHLNAVMVNNFTNHIYALSYKLCKKHQIPFDILHPLIQQTTETVMNHPPDENQTGPAKRNDTITIQKHLDLLTENNITELYRFISNQLLKKYNHNEL